MFPYKHYGTEIIEDAVDDVVGFDDLGTKDYLCEDTMKHWKWWVCQNEANINGQMRSMLQHLMDFNIKFLKSGEPLLKELKERISPGWLSAFARFIYNSGGRIEVYEDVRLCTYFCVLLFLVCNKIASKGNAYA